MGTKIDSDALLFSIYRFCRRCNETTHGVGYDHEPCHNDLCPMKFVAEEIGAMQVKERVAEKTKNTICSAVSINNQNGMISTKSNNEQRTSSKRRCPNCGSYWLSAEYCCACGERTVEDDI